MAYETRRLSTESDKSSTSTNHSTESNGTHTTLSPSLIQSTIPTDHKLSSITARKTTHSSKRNTSASSPAEIILARTKNTFVDLNPYFQCSSLPSHWRKNKSLRFILRAKQQIDIKANTRVTIFAGNDYNPCAPLKNNVSWFRDGQAEFNDLRFLGASGRGKKFTLTIIIETTPPQQCTYRRAIKITVDGPRKKREIKIKSDPNETQADESNMDGDSDNDPNTTTNSMMTDTTTATSLNQGSAGLLLLAAAAEQKRKDEEDEPNNRPLQSAPMEINSGLQLSDRNSSNTSCLSPSSSLVSQFTQSFAFSPTSSSDHIHSRLLIHPLLQQSTVSTTGAIATTTTTTTTVPLMKPIQTTNLLLSLTPKQDHLEFFNQKQTRDHQQNIVDASNTSSSAGTTTTHVLCR